MAARGAERAPAFIDPPGYARHRPEETLLYQIVAEHYPGFREARAAEGKPLPRYVEEEFEAYLKCGRLEEGFLRVRCEGRGRRGQRPRRTSALGGALAGSALTLAATCSLHART